MIGGLPARVQALSPDGTLSAELVEFLSDVYIYISGAQSSGVTDKRPAKNLFIGRTFFDTTINKPIWIGNDGSTWVDSDGNPA